jgi:hypothetical protein
MTRVVGTGLRASRVVKGCSIGSGGLAGWMRGDSDRIRKAMENTSDAIVHVRDGKPLTEHGAKLLGVEWKDAADDD